MKNTHPGPPWQVTKEATLIVRWKIYDPIIENEFYMQAAAWSLQVGGESASSELEGQINQGNRVTPNLYLNQSVSESNSLIYYKDKKSKF